MLATIGYVTWQSYDVARREINVFTARATEALNDEQFDRAMRYALQAYPARGRLPWTTPFSTELEGKLAGGALSTRLHRLLKDIGPSTSAAFSGDGKRVVTASDDNTARIWDAESGKEIAVLKGHDRLRVERGVQRRRQAGGDGVFGQHRAHLGCGERQGDRRPERPYRLRVERGVQRRWQAGGDGV